MSIKTTSEDYAFPNVKKAPGKFAGKPVPGDEFKPVQHKVVDQEPKWHTSGKQLGDVLTPTDKER